MIRAEADDLGDLKVLKLGEARVPDLATLGKRLRLYTQLLEGKPLRVRLVADDNLRYEPAARIIAVCSAAGVAAIRLTPPGATPSLPGGGERPAGIGTTKPQSRQGRRDETRAVPPGDRVALGAFWHQDAGRRLSTMIPRLPISFPSPIWPAIAQPSRVSQPPTLARASDPPVEVKFKDLWNRPDALSRPARHDSGAGRADLPPRAGRQLSIAGRSLDHLAGR